MCILSRNEVLWTKFYILSYSTLPSTHCKAVHYTTWGSVHINSFAELKLEQPGAGMLLHCADRSWFIIHECSGWALGDWQQPQSNVGSSLDKSYPAPWKFQNSFHPNSCFFIWESELYRQGNTLWECFYLLGHFPDVHAGQGWARLIQPSDSSGSCMWLQRPKHSVFHCFSLIIRRELNQGWSNQDLNQHPLWDIDVAGGSSIHSTMMSPWSLRSLLGLSLPKEASKAMHFIG